MNDSTFTPAGPTVLVGTTLVQVDPPSSNPTQRTSFRVRCLVAGYFTYTPALASNVAPTSPTTSTAPSAGSPQANTIGMAAGNTETFTLPQNCWMVASAAAAFEVTPGEGI